MTGHGLSKYMMREPLRALDKNRRRFAVKRTEASDRETWPVGQVCRWHIAVRGSTEALPELTSRPPCLHV
eukprot:4542716-Amphidinium_carterae.2